MSVLGWRTLRLGSDTLRSMARPDFDLVRLRWAVQALARPAHDQVTLFPDLACKADELALEFDEHARPLLDGGCQGLSEDRAVALTALDEFLESVSGGGDKAENWTDEALHGSLVWEKIRVLARATLAAFCWADECPPIDRGYAYLQVRHEQGHQDEDGIAPCARHHRRDPVPPPPRIDGARVLEWAWSVDPFGEILDAEGRLAAVVHGLALCRYDESSQIYRFSCDGNWDCQQDALYESIDEAKAHLPAQYRRVEPVWHRAI